MLVDAPTHLPFVTPRSLMERIYQPKCWQPTPFASSNARLRIKPYSETNSILKKLTENRRNWLAQRQWRVGRRHSPRLSRHVEIITASGTSVALASPMTPMPPVLCFDQAPEETLRELQAARLMADLTIRKMAGRRYRDNSKHSGAKLRRIGNYRPFQTVMFISTSAALVLAATYHRLRLETGFNPYIVSPKGWHAEVFDILYMIGFFDIYGINTDASKLAETDADSRTVRLVPMTSGETEDPKAVNDLVNKLTTLYPVTEGEDETGMPHLYGALIEAISNVVGHAYPEKARRVGQQNRWWMAGSVDRSSRRMTAAVFDQGVSIPVTLPEWSKHTPWRRRMLQLIGFVPSPSDPRSDGHAISAAIEVSVTSTGEEHRGHGLNQMREFVNGCQDGFLRILSRRGEVILRPGKAAEIRTFNAGVGGTLIEWNVLL